jgi:PIN domain nuclease of toxin-antitoxin system
MLNLDTHILIDFVRGQLKPRELRLVRGQDLAISGVVLWEIAKLNQLGRLELDTADPGFRALLRQLEIIPIDMEVAETSCALDFQSDPADELIAATSIVHRIALVTRDKAIRRSKIVPLA